MTDHLYARWRTEIAKMAGGHRMDTEPIEQLAALVACETAADIALLDARRALGAARRLACIGAGLALARAYNRILARPDEPVRATRPCKPGEVTVRIDVPVNPPQWRPPKEAPKA